MANPASMRLAEYLEAVNETQVAFAARSGVPHRTIHRICQGVGCSLRTAKLIVRATHARPTPSGGFVTHDELTSTKDVAA